MIQRLLWDLMFALRNHWKYAEDYVWKNSSWLNRQEEE